MLTRCAIGGRFEVRVAMPAAAAARDNHRLVGSLQIAQHMSSIAVANDGPRRDFDHQVFAAPAEAIRSLAVLAAVGPPVPLVRKVREVGIPFRGAQQNVSPAAAVAAIGPTPWRVLSRRKLRQPSPPSPPRT